MRGWWGRPWPRACLVIGAAGLCLLLAVLGVVGSGAAGPSKPHAHTAPVSAAVVRSGPLSGVELAALLGRVVLPGAFATDGQRDYDSGPVATSYGGRSWSAMTCDQAVAWIGASGFGESGYASVISADQAHLAGIVGVDAYSFATAGQASAFYAQMSARWASCGKWVDRSNTVLMLESVARTVAPPVAGASQAEELTDNPATGPADYNGSDFVAALSGSAVVIAWVADFPGSQVAGMDRAAAGIDGGALALIAATPVGTVPVMPCSIAPVVGCQ